MMEQDRCLVKARSIADFGLRSPRRTGGRASPRPFGGAQSKRCGGLGGRAGGIRTRRRPLGYAVAGGKGGSVGVPPTAKREVRRGAGKCGALADPFRGEAEGVEGRVGA